MRILAKLNEIIKAVSGIILALMIVLVIAQVLFRYIFRLPVSHIEELARYTLIWSVMLGSTIAIKNKSHIAVDFLVEKFPWGIRKVIKTISCLGIVVFCILFMVEGWSLSVKGMTQLSPATMIPVGLIAISIPISGFISLLYAIGNYYQDVIKGSGAETERSEV